MKRRLMCWPLRLKWRTHWYTFFLAGAQYTGTRGTTHLYGWFVTAGPLKLLVGKPLTEQERGV